MNNTIEIRQLKEEHRPKIIDYLFEIDRIFPDPMSSRVDIVEHTDKVLDKGVVFVALDSQRIVGVLLGYANDNELKRAYLGTIGVSEGYRSLGIGERLVHAFEQYGIEHNMRYIGAHAHCENSGALRFWKRLGFVLTFDSCKPYEKSVYFTKQLDLLESNKGI